MARNSMTLMDFVGKLLAEEDVDVLREGIRVVADALMDAEVSNLIGAQPFRSGREATVCWAARILLFHRVNGQGWTQDL